MMMINQRSGYAMTILLALEVLVCDDCGAPAPISSSKVQVLLYQRNPHDPLKIKIQHLKSEKY